MITDLHLIPNHIGTHGVGLQLPVPVFAHVASPICAIPMYWGPEETETGIVCEQCSAATEFWTATEDGHGVEILTPRRQVRHASVAHVRECYAERARQAAESAAEIWAEGAYDRWAEGGWDVTGAYSAELWQESYAMCR